MVQIFVKNISDDVCIAYEVSLHEPVSLLKALIEETEGSPIVQQSLAYEKNQLQDSDTLGSYQITEGAVVTLSATFSVVLKTLTGKFLRLPVALSDSLMVLQKQISDEEGIPPDLQRLIYKGVELNPTNTFSFYGIQMGEVVHLVLNLRGGGGYGGYSAKAYAVACYNWDGNMKHSDMKGLSLIRGTVVIITEKFDKNWYRGRKPGTYKEDFIPCNFVRIFRYLDNNFRRFDPDSILSKLLPTRDFNIRTSPSDSVLSRVIRRILHPTSPPSGPAQHDNEEDDVAALSDIPSVEEPLVLPPLPPFRYPEARPTLFGLPLGEKRHSRIEISIQYDTTALPDQPTEVHVIAKCFAAGSRRISSLSLQITVQNNKVDNVRPEKIVGPERTTEIGATHRIKTALHGGGKVGFPGVGEVDAGAERMHETEEVEKGIRFSQMQITGDVEGHSTARWVIKEAKTANSGEGLPQRISDLSFRLIEKPREFRYNCYVTSVVGREERRHHGTLG